MTRFTLGLAGFFVEVTCVYSSTKEYCKNYLTGEACDFSVEVQQSDIETERHNSERLKNFSDGHLERLALHRKIAEELIDRDVLLFHGSALEVNGEGYIFAALSGTGKSTHAALWRSVLPKRGIKVSMINDDKPMIKVTDGGVFVCGTPWNGAYRLDTNTIVPLKGICFLRRDATNHIETVGAGEVFAQLYNQTYKSSNPLRLAKTVGLLQKMMTEIKLYRLGCNMDESAAEVSYDGMTKGE